MSCPKCGHAVSSTAGNCAYCGAIISDKGDKEQTSDKLATEETPATLPEPSELPAASPRAVEMSEDVDNELKAAEKPSESIFSPQTPAEPVAAEAAETTAEAEPSAEAFAAANEVEHEDASPGIELAAAAVSAALGPSADTKSEPEIALTAAVEPEAVPLAEDMSAGNLMQEDQTPSEERDPSGGSIHQTVEEPPKDESEPEDMPASPAPEVLDVAAEESEESETLGAEIIEMIESQVSEDEEQRSKAPDEGSFVDITAVDTPSHNADDRQLNAAQESAAEKNGSLISEALEETILLEPADEVQMPAGKFAGKAAEKTKMETAKQENAAKAGAGAAAEPPNTPPDILKIENAARKMAEEIKKQKEKLAEAGSLKDEKPEKAKTQALKKKKAALAKAQAQKKQKLLLAKAAALKRKKAAEAKARALIKKRETPAGGEMPLIEKAEEGYRQKDASIAIDRNLKADSRMQDLLKKYEGQAIGINYDNSAEIREAFLEKANGEYFSVFVKDKKLHYSYPLKSILTVIEGKDGVDTGNSKQAQKFNAVIKVYPLVLF